MGASCESILSGVNDDRTDFKYVGTWEHPGRQSWDMISGAAKYPTDLWMPGTLTAMALHSPYGHAKIKSLDITEAEKVQGVHLVLTYEDEEIASMPKYRPSYYEFGASPLLGDEAEFEGDEVGVVVVADNEEACKRALDAVAVEWEALPFITDCREAAKPGAPILRPEMNPDSNMTGNTFGAPVEWEIGNVEQGLKESDHVEVIEYGRPMWSQFRSMPPAYFSYWDDDPWGNPDGEKMCYVTNHAHFPSNGPIVSAFMGFGSHADKFRALTPYMASRYCDFVEKRGAQLAPVLSKRLGGVPVRFVNTRRQSFDAAVPQTYITARIGYNDDGTLHAVQSRNVHQSGARGGYGDKTHGHLVLPPNAQAFKSTSCPNIYSEMAYYVTNGACTTADPGKDMWEPVNLAFAHIADALGMPITDVIMKNVSVTDPSLSACMEAGKKAFDWDAKWHKAGEKTLEDGRLHGVAARACWSMTWGMISYNINLRMGVDGKIYMPYSEALIGTYWPDAVQLVIAEEMGMKLEDVIVYYAPNYNNWQNGDAADRGSTCTWAAKEAAVQLKAQILATRGAVRRDSRRGGPRGLDDHPEGRPDAADAHHGYRPAGRGLLRQAGDSLPKRRGAHHERGLLRGGRRPGDRSCGSDRLRVGPRLRQGDPPGLGPGADRDGAHPGRGPLPSRGTHLGREHRRAAERQHVRLQGAHGARPAQDRGRARGDAHGRRRLRFHRCGPRPHQCGPGGPGHPERYRRLGERPALHPG